MTDYFEAIKRAFADREAIEGKKRATVGPHAHVDSGWRCLVDHGPVGPCYRCSVCGEWVPGAKA